jgi:phosphomannomutase
MLNKKIFKAYDVRGIYPVDVNIEAVGYVALALSKLLDSGDVVVARDGRHGGEELAQALGDSLIRFGKDIGKEFNIVSVGLSTTPMYYFLVNHLNAKGGAMITASHNPKEYSGVKAVREKALPFSGTEILKVIEDNNLEKVKQSLYKV